MYLFSFNKINLQIFIRNCFNKYQLLNKLSFIIIRKLKIVNKENPK